MSHMNYPFDKNWFHIYQLQSGTIAIREPHHFEDVFSFAVPTPNGKYVLFDTGMGLANIQEVLPTPISNVFLTHSHWDHIGNAENFENVFIFDHPFEVNRLKKGWSSSEIVGYEESTFSIALPTNFSLKEFFIKGKPTFSILQDGQVINVDGLEVVVIHTPGHSPGSTSFFLPNTAELITGDTLYPGPEYLHLPESNVSDYFSSLLKLESLIGKKMKSILPGHNAPSVKPELLHQHIKAFQGTLVPTKTITGNDEFGSYLRKDFKTFSLLLPQE
jgi:glyoxylase-like metal-dependent hydrolase (beta-lactamase superfamily II)